jgi:hypothetical protein
MTVSQQQAYVFALTLLYQIDPGFAASLYIKNLGFAASLYVKIPCAVFKFVYKSGVCVRTQLSIQIDTVGTWDRYCGYLGMPPVSTASVCA